MKRLRLIVMVVAVMVIGVVAIACFRAREPRYQGRTLSEWIDAEISAYQKFFGDRHNRGKDPETDPACREAIQAVRHMAPEAIPVLVDWALAENSPQKIKMVQWLNTHTFLHLRPHSVMDRNKKASFGFWMLGTASKPAWPALAQGSNSTNSWRRYYFLECLKLSNPDKEIFLPVLLRLTHDPERNVQLAASRELRNRYPKDAETAGVYTNFPELKNEPTNQFILDLPPVK